MPFSLSFFFSFPWQAVQMLPVFEYSIDLNFGSEHYSVRTVVVQKIIFHFFGVWCLEVQSKDFRRRNLFGKNEYLVANDDVRENHATSTFFVEILSPVKLQYSARGALAMFLVQRFCVPDVSSERITLFSFYPNPENLFVVIWSRSRLHSKRFPVLQLTTKDTLHR